MRGASGMMDLKKWDCGVPGKEKTIWEGGLFKLEVTFPEEYPTKPPKCMSWTALELGRSGAEVPLVFTPTNTLQASSYLRYSTPTYIHRVLSAFLSLTKKKAGSRQSRSRKSC